MNKALKRSHSSDLSAVALAKEEGWYPVKMDIPYKTGSRIKSGMTSWDLKYSYI